LLVVDDDEAIREIMSAMLTEQGYEIVTAEDGRQALELLPQFRPHLLVTDLRMPRMAGDELVRIVRESFPQLPVIVVSGEFLPDEFPTSFQADAFLSKGDCFITALEVKITQLLSRPELSAR
jgi:CheY-like chemotaxis protein